MKRRTVLSYILGAAAALPFTRLAAQQNQLVVGVIAPLTGPWATIGTGIKDGAQLAANAINAAGGVNGKRIDLLIEDDGASPPHAVQLARRLIERDKATCLIGVPLSGTALAVRTVATESDVLMISLNSNPILTSKDNKNTLRPFGNDAALATTVADFIKANFPNKKIGVWLSDYKPFSEALQASAPSRGLTFRHSETATSSGLPTWLNDVDVVVVSPGITQNSTETLVDRKGNAAIVLATDVTRDSHVELVRRGENVRVVGSLPAGFIPEARKAVDQAKDKGISTSGYFIYSYVAVQIFASLAGGQNTSGRALATLARSNEIKTAIGPLRFNDVGEIVGWHFAYLAKVGGRVDGVDLCKTPQCKDYEQCKDCK